MMTPSARLYTAVSGGIPDKVPVVPKVWVDLAARLTGTDLLDVVAAPMTALRVIAEAGLLCELDAVRQFHFPERRVLRQEGQVYEVDQQGAKIGTVDMEGGLCTHLFDAADFRLEDPFRMAFHHYWSATEPFVKEMSDADRIVVPPKTFYEEIGCGDRQRQILNRVGERLAIIGDCSSATLAFYVCMRGMSAAMLDLVERPQLVRRVMEKGVAIAIEKGKFNIDSGIKVLRLNDSVGNMSVISPRHWRKFIFPHIHTICEELHHYDRDVRIYCHICGNILPIAEDLARTGLDCIGPLDPLGGFTPADVRQRVGEAVALMGGVNTLTFVEGTPEQILDEAKTCMRQAGTQGGYILSSGCVVPRKATLEHLRALRRAAERYGVYDGAALRQDL